MRRPGCADSGGAPLDEDAIIARYFRRPPGRADVSLGIGDDAALIHAGAGCDLAIAMDTLVEGTHFLPDAPPRSLGHRVLAVNLSDLAAMGARPAWSLLSLSLPEPDADWLEEFAAGLFALAQRHEVALIGGDTVRGPRAMTITLQGLVPPEEALRRSGARVGDGIYVSGHPGEAGAGRLLSAQEAAAPGPAALRARFLYPEPRVGLGLALRGVATAAIDISDGLHRDLGRLLAASGVGAELEVGALPLSEPLREVAGAAAVERALTGGEDYELCFTLPGAAAPRVAELAAAAQCTLTRIGTVTAATGQVWRQDGRVYAVPGTGFRHF